MQNKPIARKLILLSVIAITLLTACGPTLTQSDAAEAIADYYQFEKGWGPLFVSVPDYETCSELSDEAVELGLTAAYIIEFSVEGTGPDEKPATDSGNLVIIGTSQSSRWMVDDSYTTCP